MVKTRPFEPFDTQQGTWTGSFRFLALLQSVSSLNWFPRRWTEMLSYVTSILPRNARQVPNKLSPNTKLDLQPEKTKEDVDCNTKKECAWTGEDREEEWQKEIKIITASILENGGNKHIRQFRYAVLNVSTIFFFGCCLILRGGWCELYEETRRGIHGTTRSIANWQLAATSVRNDDWPVIDYYSYRSSEAYSAHNTIPARYYRVISKICRPSNEQKNRPTNE